jgi:shikimate kinase
MNIILVGFRCSGKTSVGKALAKELDREFFDTDILIERHSGCSVDLLIEKKGWENFRDIEREVIGEVSMKDNLVIATGGGIVMNQENIRNLKKNGWVIWLKAEEDTIRKRMTRDDKVGNARPPIMGSDSLEEIHKVLKIRKPLYNSMCDMSVDCDTISVDEIMDSIVKVLPEGF